jgi:dihydroorotase
MAATIYNAYTMGKNINKIFELQLALKALNENYQHMTNQLYILESTARELNERVKENG